MKYIYTLAICLSIMTCPVYGATIKAIVGDIPISDYDVQQRVKLMKLQSPSSAQGKTQQHLTEQALENLIDEQIKGQTAKKQGLSVSQEDINSAITHLEQQNNLPSGEMVKSIKNAGIQLSAFYQQIQSDLLWLQYINTQKHLLPSISKQDVKTKKSQLAKQLEHPSYLLAEIVVPTKQLADQIFTQVQQGMSFAELVKQHSTAPSKQSDGVVGWVPLDYYSSDIAEILSRMVPSEMTKPIQRTDGWIIVLMLDKQEGAKNGKITIWDMAQMTIPNAQTVALMPKIMQIKNCDEFKQFAQQHATPNSFKQGMVHPASMPPELKQTIEQRQDYVAGPIQTPTGNLFFMTCAKQQKSLLPTDAEIKSAIEMERLDDLSQKLLHQAKRYAVIEYK